MLNLKVDNVQNNLNSYSQHPTIISFVTSGEEKKIILKKSSEKAHNYISELKKELDEFELDTEERETELFEEIYQLKLLLY